MIVRTMHLPPWQRGEQHRNSRLTEDQAREIKFSELSVKKLAAKYGISKNTVNDIKAGRRWRHIT